VQSLFTNSKSRHDFFDNYFLGMKATPCYVFAAVAFFTHHEIVTRLLSVGCRVDLVVRLGYPTSPKALGELMGREGVRLRYVTDTSFHPKLYIFDEVGAVVGSSNLTSAAMRTNQEVNVVVPVDDERYGELRTLFQEYWKDARTMDEATLDSYRRAYDQHAGQFAKISMEMENRVHKDIGRVTINNIERGLPKPGKTEIELDGYRKTYQEFEDCFRTVLSVYQGLGQRRYTGQQLPLRLEIDQYLSYVRDAKTVGDSYLLESRQTGAALEQRIRDTALEFMAADRKYSDNTVVKHSYPTINRILGSKASIASATYDDLIEALSCVHSFRERLRFFAGGHETHVAAFRAGNSLDRVKFSLTYLLHGDGDYVTRMGNCIFNPDYQLNQFGRSATQETLGWVNREGIPICNNRTLRAMFWLGLSVKLVGD
jgi:hypothetical protein